MKSKYVVNDHEDDDLFHLIEKSSDYDKSTIFGKLLFLWQWRFFFRNYNKKIKVKDIPKGRRTDNAEYVYNEFQKYWDSELARAKRCKRKPNLVYPIFHQYGCFMIFLSVFCLVAHYALLAQALYLDDLIRDYNALNKDNKDVRKEIIITSLLIVGLMLVYCNCANIFYYHTNLIAIRVRACLSEFIYRKSLRLSKSAIGKTSTGQITNFLSTDMNRIDYFFILIPFPFTGFTLLAWAVYKLWVYLSYFTLFGIIFLFLVLPIQSAIGAIFSRMRLKAAEFTDERLRLVDEFINAIKVIKFYTWEYQFAEKIDEARKKEIGKIKRSLYIYSFTLGLFTSTTKIIVFIILVTFHFSGRLITDRIVFLTLAVFNQITFLITVFIPHFILNTSNFWISIKRINKFLTLEEKCELLEDDQKANSINLKPILQNGNSNGLTNRENKTRSKEYDLEFKNVTACYSVVEGVENPDFLDVDKDSTTSKNIVNALKHINITCKPNELLIVVGPVGSGKTSLLQAILSELKIRSGSIEVNGKLSYACQEPWTFSGTIRENILFDSELNQKKYDEVIKVCALERDLALFQDGDQTQIGERGVALSGGQKARLSLARALYFEADIYLLDDPLSAVDPHVAKTIFKRAIKGFLEFKTIILVTHQLNYVKYSDKVLFLKDGQQILFEDSAKAMNLLSNEPDSEFARFIGGNTGFQAQKTKKMRKDSGGLRDSIASITQSLVSRRNSLSLDSSLAINYDEEHEQNQMIEIKKIERERRLKEEDDQVRVVYKAYVDYFSYGKIWFWGPILITVFGATQIFATSCDLFLKKWADSVKVHDKNDSSLNSNVSSFTLLDKENEIFNEMFTEYGGYLYSLLIVGFFVLSLARSILHSIFSMKVSVGIHDKLFKRIVRAKMKFFYTNPVGIILNRFSRDIAVIDDDIPFYFHDFIEITLNSLTVFFVMAISNPYLIIPFSVFILLAISFRTFYITTGRSLETLEGVSKSPIIQHLSTTLNGLSTVRAFKVEKNLIKKFNRYQNDHTAAHFMAISCKRWFVYVLDNLQTIFVSGSFLVLILLAEKFSGSLIGLIVTYVLMFSGEFQWCIICWSSLETFLCCVDRIEKLGMNIDSKDEKSSLAEPPLESSEDAKPPSDWPQKGIIEFRNVTMRYYETEKPVLYNLNFTVQESEKIGITGRTGAGKSSIIAALFRLTEYEGEILIDNINCKSIGLHDLRGCISVIPQEPVLFTGTIRTNLDPIGAFADHQLWNALKAVQLEQIIKELDGGLDSKVMDGGANFSVGQKQLICLARAILKANRIIVLDEATANCDPKTDELIQNTIRTVFKHCSILTIAHRLNTIMDSTKVLVLDAGEIKEYDEPHRLLQNPNSLFSSMVDACGAEQAKKLKKIAEEASKRK